MLEGFAAGLGGAHAAGAARGAGFGRRRPPGRPPAPRGVYLDGGYGVGKTHLLASLWHATPAEPERKAFGTFVELTNLVGALGFQQTVRTLSRAPAAVHRRVRAGRPGRHRAGLHAARPAGRGRACALAATSNTLPGKLGEGRFAAADFLREIQGLSAHFRAAAHRRRGLPPPRPARGAGAVHRRRRSPRPRTRTAGASLDDFPRSAGRTSPGSTRAATARCTTA